MEAQLSGLVCGDDGFRGWLAGGGLRGVETLIVWDAELTDEAAVALVDARPDALAALDLSWNRVGAAGAAALASGLAGLARLRLYHNDLGADGAAAIARRAGPLRALNVCGNAIGDAGVAELACGRLDSLEELALGWNDIGDDGARAIAAGQWPQLAFLNVRANRLDAEGAAAVMALPALRRLGIDDNPLGDSGLAAILASPGFARIEWLNLGGTGLDERAVERFAAVGRTTLRELRIHDNDLGEDACAALRAALPDCEVVS